MAQNGGLLWEDSLFNPPNLSSISFLRTSSFLSVPKPFNNEMDNIFKVGCDTCYPFSPCGGRAKQRDSGCHRTHLCCDVLYLRHPFSVLGAPYLLTIVIGGLLLSTTHTLPPGLMSTSIPNWI